MTHIGAASEQEVPTVAPSRPDGEGCSERSFVLEEQSHRASLLLHCQLVGVLWVVHAGSLS